MREETQPVLVAIERLSGIVERNMETTKIQLDAHSGLLKTHSEEIWGSGDANPGLKVKVKELTDTEKGRKTFKALVTAGVTGLGLERLWHYLIK